MKVSCQREHLLEFLGLVEKVSGRNLSLPVLSCVLVVAHGKTLTLRATNLELGIEATVPAKVSKEGIAAVPATVFHNTISATYDSPAIALELTHGNLRVTTAGSTSTLKAQPHEDFPTLPSIKKPVTFTVSADDFLRGVRAVWYSASLSSIKPELASVYLYPGDKRLVFVATDSFRLAEKVVSHSHVAEFSPLLIPFRNAADIIRVLDHMGGDVRIDVSDSQISFVYDNLYLTSRLVEGTFPDYKQIIPKDTAAEAVVLKQDLVNAFKKVNVFIDRFSQVSVQVQPSKKLFTLRATNADVGETTETVNAALSGSDLEIHFNLKYLTDCFQSIASDSVRLLFTGLAKPVVIRGVSDSSFTYLVMPMNR